MLLFVLDYFDARIVRRLYLPESHLGQLLEAYPLSFLGCARSYNAPQLYISYFLDSQGLHFPNDVPCDFQVVPALTVRLFSCYHFEQGHPEGINFVARIGLVISHLRS